LCEKILKPKTCCQNAFLLVLPSFSFLHKKEVGRVLLHLENSVKNLTKNRKTPKMANILKTAGNIAKT